MTRRLVYWCEARQLGFCFHPERVADPEVAAHFNTVLRVQPITTMLPLLLLTGECPDLGWAPSWLRHLSEAERLAARPGWERLTTAPPPGPEVLLLPDACPGCEYGWPGQRDHACMMTV